MITDGNVKDLMNILDGRINQCISSQLSNVVRIAAAVVTGTNSNGLVSVRLISDPLGGGGAFDVPNKSGENVDIGDNVWIGWFGDLTNSFIMLNNTKAPLYASAEALRDGAEQQRQTEEAARQTAEAGRVAAEMLRDEKVGEVYAAFTAGELKGDKGEKGDKGDKGDPGSYETHAHGNLTNGGAIGTAAGKLVVTGAGGLLTAGRTLAVGATEPSEMAASLGEGDVYIYCPTMAG